MNFGRIQSVMQSITGTEVFLHQFPSLLKLLDYHRGEQKGVSNQRRPLDKEVQVLEEGQVCGNNGGILVGC